MDNRLYYAMSSSKGLQSVLVIVLLDHAYYVFNSLVVYVDGCSQ